jgi:hypothetical protein
MNAASWEIMSTQSRDFFKTDVRNDAAEKANLKLFRP